MITIDTRKAIIKILSGLLTFIFFFTFNVFFVITLVRISITKDLIKDIIKYEYDVNDIVINNTIADNSIDKLYTLNPNDYIVSTDINENDNKNIELRLQELLKDNNLPFNLYKYIENTDENIEIVSNIINNTVNYSLGIENELKIDKEELTVLINNAINNYESSTGSEVDKANLDTFINDFEDYYKNDLLIIDNNSIKTINSILYGFFYKTIIIVNIIILLILVAINYNNVNVLLNISIPILVTGITYLLVAKFIINNVENYNVVDTLLKNAINLGTKLTIYSLVGIGIYIILKIVIKKKKESEENA